MIAALLAVMMAVEGGESERWIQRHRPQNHDLTVDVYAGVFATSPRLELFDSDTEEAEYDRAAADFGLRVGYFPLRFFGIEGEMGVMPTRYGGKTAMLYTARAQGVLQLGFWRISPFAALGGGVIGVTSSSDTAGSDADQALHVGGGVRFNVSKRIGLRIDVRDVISPADDGSERPSHNAEALFAVAIRFGVAPKPPPPPPPPPDEDGDGVADEDDWCPKVAGGDPKGCPFGDSDCDNVADNVDKCPSEAGTGPDGCNPPDADGDGIADAVDKCVDEPETVNGVDDGDGCPEAEVPTELEDPFD